MIQRRAERHVEVTRQTLELLRQDFGPDVRDYVGVVQAQESVAETELDLINSIFSHNVAKLSLLRAIGRTADQIPAFLNLQQRA